MNITSATEKERLLSIGKASEHLGVSIDTLRRWEKKGKVETYRSPGGHRYFNKSDLDRLFGTTYERDGEETGEQKKKGTEEQKEEQKEESADIKEKTNGQSEKQDQILKAFDRPVRKFEIPESVPIKIKVEYQQKYHPSFSHLSHTSSIPPAVSTPSDTPALLPQISLESERPESPKPLDLTNVEVGSTSKKVVRDLIQKPQVGTIAKSKTKINFKIVAVVLFTIAFAAFTIYLYLTKPKIISPIP